MFDRRLVQHFDWFLFVLVIVIGGIGVFTINSAESISGTSHQGRLYIKQMIWLLTGFVCLAISLFFSYKHLDKSYGIIFYLICIVLLIWVHVNGRQVGGAQRWLVFGPLTIQPSEIVKLAVIVLLSKYYAQHVRTDGLTFRELIIPGLILALPILLIAKQPDLGTAMVILIIAATITVFVKIERRTFLTLFLTGTALIPMGWFMLQPYQKRRIETFLNPDQDPLGAGYHVLQSKIAIGSGMFGGKGFKSGSQSSLAFLPEQHTDFIFSVFSEEWGFIGAGLLLLLFLSVVWRGFAIASGCRERFGTILSVGIISLFFWEIFINIGMVMGILPVVGVPLPLMSYGGSSVITIMLGMGLLLNVGMRRYLFDES